MWNWNSAAQVCEHKEAKSRRHLSFGFSLLRVLFLIAIWTSTLPKTALANAAPPLPKLWLTFVGEDSKPINLSAVQVLGCTDEVCAAPELQAQFGMCNAAPCLLNQPATTMPFECKAQHCLLGLSSGFPRHFRLIAQTENLVAVSPIIRTQDLSFDFNAPKSLRVVFGDVLVITPDPRAPNFDLPQNFGPAFLLTLVTEVLIAIAFLFAFKKPPLPLLLLIGLMQALSFPVVWLFFPSLQAWQLPNNRLLGLLLFVIALAFGALLVWVRHATTRNTRTLSILALTLAVPAALVCLFFAMLLAGYSLNQFPNPLGLPYPLMLMGAEAFAVIYEAVLIYWLSNRSLSLKQSCLMSLTANTVSFGLGLLLFPISPML
jgi:hypothetical protein